MIIESNDSYENAFCIIPTNKPTDQFETINPIKKEKDWWDENKEVTAKRKDKNVSSMTNFVFEFDNLEKKEQLEIIKRNIDIINRVVYSGGKSFHCRVSIDFEPESKDEYKYIWEELNKTYFEEKADRACSNPARLTRKPNGKRENGKIQNLIYESKVELKTEFLHKKFLLNKERLKMQYAMVEDENKDKLFHKRKNLLIYDELEEMREKSCEKPGWQKAKELVDGICEYQDAPSAIKYIGILGFSAEEIFDQIEWGKWNIGVEYIEKILEGII